MEGQVCQLREVKGGDARRGRQRGRRLQQSWNLQEKKL